MRFCLLVLPILHELYEKKLLSDCSCTENDCCIKLSTRLKHYYAIPIKLFFASYDNVSATLLSLIDEPVRLLNGGRFCRQIRLLWSGSFNRK